MFYAFVHNVYKQNDSLFSDILEWLESIINFMRTGYARERPDQKENRVIVDMEEFVKTNLDQNQWNELNKETDSLCEYFAQVKAKKREEARRVASLEHSKQPDYQGDLIAKELSGFGLQPEDLDEFEMINYNDGDEIEGRSGALKFPSVPVIDTLKDPFAKLMDKKLFQSARE
jgi:hypothetical protein